MTDKSAAVEGFALTGEEVANLKDTHFTIHAEPTYVSVTDPSGKELRKIIIPIELANGVKLEWYANKTSQKVIIAKKGRILSDWIGYKGEFITKNQVIGKDERAVIYLKD